ncbi:unnamed protein product [Discula destructiva]
MTTPKLTLWISPGACSLVPHILLNEANLPYELTVVDVTKHGGFPDKYASVNWKKVVPILEVQSSNDVTPIIITELPAICTYIHQLAPSAHVMGATDLEFVRVLEWFNWLTGIVHHRGFGGLFRPAMYSNDERAWSSIQEVSRAHIEKCFGEIEAQLRPGGAFAVGDGLTAVDAFLYAIWRWVHMLQMDLSPYPKFKVLVEDVVVKRKAVVVAVDKESIPLVDDNRGKPPVTDAAY